MTISFSLSLSLVHVHPPRPDSVCISVCITRWGDWQLRAAKVQLIRTKPSPASWQAVIDWGSCRSCPGFVSPELCLLCGMRENSQWQRRRTAVIDAPPAVNGYLTVRSGMCHPQLNALFYYFFYAPYLSCLRWFSGRVTSLSLSLQRYKCCSFFFFFFSFPLRG